MIEQVDWKSLVEQWDDLPLEKRQEYLLHQVESAVKGKVGKELNVLQFEHTRGYDTQEGEDGGKLCIPNDEHMLTIHIGLCHHTEVEGVCTKCGWPWKKDAEQCR